MLFATFEVAVNAAVLNHLANVQVTLGGVTVPGIFRKPSSVANLGNGAADTSPSVTVASSAVMAEPESQLIHIAGVPYAIVRPEPDGTGLTKLTVECVQ